MAHAPGPSRVFGLPKMTSQKFSIRKLEAFCYRYPLSTPVVTSFGRMLDRPAVFVRVEDDDGLTGWGEVWANFPSIGAEHRARLVNEVLAPVISGFTAGQPADVFEKLTRATAVLALQSGEPGPFAQAIDHGRNGKHCVKLSTCRWLREKTSPAGQASSKRSATMSSELFSRTSPNGEG